MDVRKVKQVEYKGTLHNNKSHSSYKINSLLGYATFQDFAAVQMTYQYFLDETTMLSQNVRSQYPGMQLHIPAELLPIIRKAKKKLELVEHVLQIQRKKD